MSFRSSFETFMHSASQTLNCTIERSILANRTTDFDAERLLKTKICMIRVLLCV